MVSSAKNRTNNNIQDIQLKRDKFRSLLLENLERREMMANDFAAPVFAPGTSNTYVDSILNRMGNGNLGGSGNINLSGSRWVNPVGGNSPNQGDPAVITWSITPDGTSIPDGFGGGAAQSSNLIAFMDGIYGSAPGPVSQRPWFNIFDRAYQRWSELSGITFVYEPNDDGLPSGGANRGIAGVRGDVRVAGRSIDGDFGVLAYNYFPNGSGNSGFDGDMVIDTTDIFFRQNAQSPTAENRALFNVLMHESGHGIGLGHVIPTDQTKLMEPFISSAYLGAQHDDIIGAQTLYGDDWENNDKATSATDLGLLSNGIQNFTNRSIDNVSDVDYAVFRVPSAAKLSISLTPVGKTYLVGPQGGNATSTDSLRYKDLSFQLEAADGTVLVTANSNGLGETEEIVDFPLTAAGTYRLRVNGNGSNNTQLYDLNMRVSGIASTSADQRPPRLLSVAPNSGEIFGINRINVLPESPRELVFRFDGSQQIDINTLSGIKISRSGGDGLFGQNNDVVIVPGWVGFGDNQRIVIARFATPLPDDIYKIEVLGVDLTGENRTAIRNTDGAALRPRKVGSDRDTLFMNLELGAQIRAVVPQPVSRDNLGRLQQSRKTIDVYFNDDDLGPSATDPQYYKLILTKDSVNPNDDSVFSPSTVTYDPVKDMATLTFGSDIDSLAGGSGTFRLRIGSNDAVASNAAPIVPVELTFGPDVGNTVDAAQSLSALPFTTAQSFIVNQEIRMGGQALPDYPGSNFEPGHRDIDLTTGIGESHLSKLFSADGSSDIATRTYSFLQGQSYGVDSAGRPVFTTISPDQIARVREIFEFLSMQWGIDFVETTKVADLNIVVGDLAQNGEVSGPGGVLGVAKDGLAIMDQSESWDNTFGNGANILGTNASFFNVAFHEIMHLLGLGHAYDQPVGTIMGGSEQATDPSNLAEWFFPGNIDTEHGQYLFRPDNKDVDMYKFDVPAGVTGSLQLETIAERLKDSSLVDTHLTLLRRTPNSGLQIVALNDNYFSEDSLIRTTVDGGDVGAEYFIVVTSRGNQDFNPLVDNTGSGGVSAGSYQLKIDFKPANASSILDTSGTPIDGDGDGLAGGNFDFWFRAAAPQGVAVGNQPRTLFVDKQYTGNISNGALLTPFKSIPAATAAANAAISAGRLGDIIRIVGTIGADKQLSTTRDNAAYEIGINSNTNKTLDDGKILEVPKGVTVMVDAGAIFKIAGSEIVAGSTDASNDRSAGALQILGVPGTPVYFTSYYDETIGIDTNQLNTVAQPGDWGGLEFRLDADREQGRRDREREGVFLNYVAFGDMKYGGGQIGEGTQTRVVNPIHMTESRPTILNNVFSKNADAGMSADPNSLEESTFSEPRYHITGEFTTDYNRVGPVIRGNLFSNNSINGLQIRIDTLAGTQLKPLSVAGRIDDTDVTYFLGENLIIAGTPGGPVLETVRPDSSLVVSTATTGGTLVAGTYNYVITNVDKAGSESLFSLPTVNGIVGAGGALQLTKLPAATGDFVGRRLYRSQVGGVGPYTLAAELNLNVASYKDTGITIGGLIDPFASPVPAHRARLDASLVIDPGVVIKALGSRIEVGIGANLIAEGSTSKPVVFTSRLDDRYGAGGTFDLNNDLNASKPSAKDWSGIVARHLSTLSLDNVLVTFGGGSSSVPGGFASFNAVEVHEATARIAHSVFDNNGSGAGNPGTTNRDSRGPNDASVIFVVGSQPIIVDNIIRNSASPGTAAISIDANSLKAISVTDYGRSTGPNNRVDYGLGNQGPLIQQNRLGENAVNGMRVRGGILTTETVWDDTDIVHVLQSNIDIPNFHTYGGMRLQSKVNESLVVKLFGPNAGITAGGIPIDNPDRIGGSLQVIGSPGFPVVLTSISDDSIGAGFDPEGRSQTDTDGTGTSTGKPGDWRSLKFDATSNDRNVETTFELEADRIQDRAVNDIPDTAQDIGQLAKTLQGGDENLRLGVTVHGTIAAPSDLDVYRFTATAGTMVWVDLDRTGGGLDSVVEVLDVNGNIIALSDNSFEESVSRNIYVNPNPPADTEYRAYAMDSSAFAHANAQSSAQVDFQSVNPLDAGLRIVLPGVAGTTNPYYIRVRSSNRLPGDPVSKLVDQNELLNGITTGPYRLQVRLQQQDEIAGSTVRFADIRFATNGIELIGMPGHSPLLGESSEVPDDKSNPNEQASGALPLGNLGNSDRAALSAAASIIRRDDVDWFKFSIHRDQVQRENSNHISTVFDIDYADGLGRVDSTLWVYQVTQNGPKLVLIGTDSSIADDQAAPQKSSEVSDLGRGSFGARDPFIGAAELPDGDYLVAVSNSSMAEVQLQQYSQAFTVNPLIRIEPVDSVLRYSSERFDPPGAPETASGPIAVSFGGFTNDPSTQTFQNAIPWTLADLTAYLATGSGGSSNLNFSNALTGNRDAEVGAPFFETVDIAVSPEGFVRGFTNTKLMGNLTDNASGQFINIDGRGNGTTSLIQGGSGIQTFETTVDANGNKTIQQSFNAGTLSRVGNGMEFTALAYADNNGSTERSLFGVASRGNDVTSYLTWDLQIGTTRNYLYRLDDGGRAVSPPAEGNRVGNDTARGPGTNIREYGHFTAAGTIMGLAESGVGAATHQMFAVSDRGELFSLNCDDFSVSFGEGTFIGVVRDNGVPIKFTGLTNGPRNLFDEKGKSYDDILFGVTAAGKLYAFDHTGKLLPIFPKGRSSITMTTTAPINGIDFSSLDTNLWHLTNTRSGDQGHGVDAAFDGSRGGSAGGNSLYFGFDQTRASRPGNWAGVYDIPAFNNTYDLPGGAHGSIESNPIDLRGYTPDDQPMLYFNYHLDTETKQSPNTDNAFMRDSFRVYGALPNGTWMLLGTNNSFKDNNYTNLNDEYEPANSGYTDSFGKSYRPQELFDIQEPGAPDSWRQARINLAPFAGQNNVKLRFEFSTEGDYGTQNAKNRYGLELTAVTPSTLKDGDTFTLSDGVTDTTFEFDMGLVLNLPSGASLVDGGLLTVEGVDFVFNSTATGALNEIVYDPAWTPTEVANAVNTALTNAGFGVFVDALASNILNVKTGVTSTGTHGVTGLDPAIIIGRPGVSIGNAVVDVNQSMTLVEARNAIRASLAATLNVVGQETNLDPWPVYENSIRIFGFDILDLGKLGGLQGPRPGDAFEGDSVTDRDERAQNNAFSGVFVDDIIIGFAERGEMVHHFTTGTFQSFQPDSLLAAGGLPFDGQFAPLNVAPTETGAYQLEIRTGADYGFTQSPTSLSLSTFPPTDPLPRSFDTNDRLAKQSVIEVLSPSGIRDGAIMTLSDGQNTATYEFDVVTSLNDTASGVQTGNIPIVIDPGFTVSQVANAITDAINSPSSRALINITASVSGKNPLVTGATSENSLVYLHGPAATNIYGDITQIPNSLKLTLQGTDTDAGQDLGDRNVLRDQGQMIVQSTFVRDSANFGILVDAGGRTRTDLAPNVGTRVYPGSPRNLVTLNTAKVAPGVVLINNILAGGGAGGIQVSGDTINGGISAPTSIARLINNTIVGISGVGVGIDVNQGASPTILNNILSNLKIGVSVDALSNTTELGANIYKTNAQNTAGVSNEADAILLKPTDPLFANLANGRFYLAPKSQAIDSSRASLEERSALSQVKNGVGLQTSPMIAPNRDIGGLLRVDDPTVSTPAGVGQNVNIDRGAVDRSDFNGPKAVLINPLDNDSANVDVDRNSTFVRLVDGNLSYFSILLDESRGTGPDPATISAASLILTENGRILKPDVDYIFGFSANSREIHLTPLSGFWRRDSVYEMTLNNAPRVRLDAPVGSTVSDGDQLVATLNDGSKVTLEYESGFVLQVPQTLTLVVPSAGAGPAGITDGQRFRIKNGSLDVEFEFDTDSTVSNGTRPVVIPAIASASDVRDAIIATLLLPGNSDLNLAPTAVGKDRVNLGTLSQHAVVVTNSLLTAEGTSAGIEDGQQFVVARIGQPAVTFEFNLQGDANVTAGSVPITILRSDTFEDIAEKVATATAPYFTDGFAPVTHIAGGFVQLGGKVGDNVSVGPSKLILTGKPGVSDSLELTVPATGGAAITDGQQFSITIGATTVLYEFTKDLVTGAGTWPISIRNSDSATALAQKISNAIQTSPIGLNPVATVDKIKLNEPHGTVIDLKTTGITSTGVPGGAVAINFVPSPSFDIGLMGGQLTKSLNQIGLGVKAVMLGTGTVMVDGVNAISGGTSSLVPPVRDYAGNLLQPNRANALTQFTVVMPETLLDYGDASGAGSETLQVENGARHALLPEDEPLLVLGASADADADGVLDSASQGDDIDSLVILNTLPLDIGVTGPAALRFPAPSPALFGKSVDVKDSRLTTVKFQFINGGSASVGFVAVNIAGALTADDVALAFANAVLAQLLSGKLVDLVPIANGDQVTLGGTSTHTVSLANAAGTGIQRLLQGRLELSVKSPIAGNYVDGQLMTLFDGSGNSVQFELNNTTTLTPVAVGNVAINVDLTTATPAILATALADAVNGQIAAGTLRMPLAKAVGATVTLQLDDEEGVKFNGLFNSSARPVPVVITSTGTGMVDAWIDWNNDGSFKGTGEQILLSAPVHAGENTFFVQTPVGAAVGFINARFRLSTVGGLLTNGVGIGGEVEDYKIEVLAGTPPVALNDAYAVDEDNLLSVVQANGVLKNDSDIDVPAQTITVYDSDPITPGVQPAVLPQHGTLVLNANGSFVYDSDPDYFGPDSFVYYAFDGRLISNVPATVVLTVNPVNDAPTAVDDKLFINEDEVVKLPGSTFWSNDIKGPPNESGQTLKLVGARIITPRGNGEVVAVVNDELRYTPPADYNNRLGGPVLLELTIRDGGVAGGDANPLESKSTLTVNLKEINDAPTYAMPTTQTTTEDAGLVTVASFIGSILPGTVTATDEVTIDHQVVSFNVRALNPSLFAVQPTITNNNDGTATLKYKLAADVNNQNRPNPADLRVEVIAVDDGLSTPPPNVNAAAPRTFTISATSVNDAPTFVLADTKPKVNEDAGVQVINGFAANILPGPPTADDEANQTLSFTLTARDPSAFKTQPSMTTTGILTYELERDVNSRFKDLTVDVVLKDNGPTGGLNVNQSTQSFSIVAKEINDAPDFLLPSLQVTALEDNEAETGVVTTTFTNFATNIVKGPATALDEPIFQNVNFTVISVSRPELFTTLPAISPNGTLTFQTAKDQNGSAVVVVQLVDTEPGTAPNVNVSELKTFTINLTAVNDVPEFTLPTTATSVEDQGLVSILNFATGMRPGPVTAADESGQKFTVVATAIDPSKFTVQPTIGADGTLRFRTGPDVNSANSDLRVQVFLFDDGPSSPAPNKNKSAVQTFTIVTSQINDAPLFTLPNKQLDAIEDQEAFTGVSPSVKANFVTNILMGPPTATDETTQTPTFLVTASAPELFSVQPSIDATGKLSYVTAPNKNGRSLLLIRLRDSGLSSPPPNFNLSLEQTATITIAAINDAPQFDIPATTTVNEDQGLVSIAGFATNVLRGPLGADDESTQVIDFVAVAVDPTAFEVQPSLLPDGTLSFKTAKDINRNSGLDLRVIVSLRDDGASSPAPNVNVSIPKVFSIDIVPINDPPIPDSLVVSGTEDAPVTVQASDALAGDVPGPIDELGQTLKITQVERSSDRGGTVAPILDAQGNLTAFTYTPGANVVGLDFFRYVVTDNGAPNRSATGTITINIAGVNDPPQFTSGPNSIIVFEDSGASVSNWAKDILAGPPGAIDENSGPTRQTVSFEVNSDRPSLFSQAPAIDASGVLRFTPAPDANGSTVITVTAVDSGSNVAPNVNRSQTATFTITINAVNDAPVFTPGGNVTVEEDSTAYNAVWATGIKAAAGLPNTATDELSQSIDFVTTTNKPAMFAVPPSVSSDGKLSFALASNANGVARVVVVARDSGSGEGLNKNLSDPQTFTITVNAVNDAPEGTGDSFDTTEDSLLTVAAPGLLANDNDIDLPNDILKAKQIVSVSDLGAAVTVNPDGSFSYDPRNVASIQRLFDGQVQTDRFTYRVEDAAGALSNPVTVVIRLTGVNDAPVAVADSFVVASETKILLPVLSNDFDVDTPIDPTTIQIGELPLHGKINVLQTGSIEYTTDKGYRGTDSFTYKVKDVRGLFSNEARVSLTTNNPPTAVNDSVTTPKDRPILINVLRNDFDVEDTTLDPTSVQVVVNSPAGTTVVQPDGQILFTPATGFVGNTTFSYVAADKEKSFSNVAVVNVRVTDSIYQNPVNRYDVNADGFISPIDALLIINDLNLRGTRDLPPDAFVPPPFLDVNGNNRVEPLDALEVINLLNQRGNGEGEGEGAFGSQIVTMVSPEQMMATVGPQVVSQVRAALADTIASFDEHAIATVPAIAAYPTGRLGDVDHSKDSLDDVLNQLAARESGERNRKSSHDDVFAELGDDLLA